MRRAVAGLLAVALVHSAAAGAADEIPARGTYVHPLKKFTLRVPPGARVVERGEKLDVLIQSPSGYVINVQTGTVNPDVSLRDMAAKLEAAYPVLTCTISRTIRRSSEVIRPGARRAAMRSPSQTPGNAAGGLGRPPFGSRFPLPRSVGNACRWAPIAGASPPAEGTGNAIVWYAKSCKGVLGPVDS